jgi:hypothetical protein
LIWNAGYRSTIGKNPLSWNQDDPGLLSIQKSFRPEKKQLNHEAVIKKRGAERFLENISYSNG